MKIVKWETIKSAISAIGSICIIMAVISYIYTYHFSYPFRVINEFKEPGKHKLKFNKSGTYGIFACADQKKSIKHLVARLKEFKDPLECDFTVISSGSKNVSLNTAYSIKTASNKEKNEGDQVEYVSFKQIGLNWVEWLTGGKNMLALQSFKVQKKNTYQLIIPNEECFTGMIHICVLKSLNYKKLVRHGKIHKYLLQIPLLIFLVCVFFFGVMKLTEWKRGCPSDG